MLTPMWTNNQRQEVNRDWLEASRRAPTHILPAKPILKVSQTPKHLTSQRPNVQTFYTQSTIYGKSSLRFERATVNLRQPIHIDLLDLGFEGLKEMGRLQSGAVDNFTSVAVYFTHKSSKESNDLKKVVQVRKT